jgi:ribosomal protein S11
LPPPQPKSDVHGSDNTLIGNVGNRSVSGDGNTIVGATDAQGNTILNQGGTAIGRGATADPTSIAIGAGAHAGGQQSYGPQTCVGSACAQGPGSQATFNQFSPPRLEITSAQRETIRDAMKPYAGTTARIMTSTNDEDAKQFGAQLVGALQDANLSVIHKEAGSMVVEGAKPFGISINFSEDHQPAAIALEKEILKLGVRPALTLYNRPQDIGHSFLTVVVQPTR